jgi:hypothetical protein
VWNLYGNGLPCGCQIGCVAWIQIKHEEPHEVDRNPRSWSDDSWGINRLRIRNRTCVVSDMARVFDLVDWSLFPAVQLLLQEIINAQTVARQS